MAGGRKCNKKCFAGPPPSLPLLFSFCGRDRPTSGFAPPRPFLLSTVSYLAGVTNLRTVQHGGVLCNQYFKIVLAGRRITEMPDTERRKPEASRSSDFLPSLRPQKLLEGAACSSKPQSLLHYRLRSYSSRSRSRITQNSIFPPDHGPTEIGGTVQTAFGCIDILRPTSEHDQLRTPRLQVNFAKTATHAILRRTARPSAKARHFD